MEGKERIRKPLPLRAKRGRQRVTDGDFTYPLGAYPEYQFPQKSGFDSKYIREGGYFYYQIAVSYEKILPVFSHILRLLPGRKVVAVTQIHTEDYYKDFDVFVSRDTVDVEKLVRWIKDWRDVALDDGFFGIGAFTESPSCEVFLDEHKTIHVYHNDPDLMESALEKLGINFELDLKLYWDEAHYHEPMPLLDEDSENFLTGFEDLADKFDLVFDEGDDENTDEHGDPLGLTCWKVELRGYKPKSDGATDPKGYYTTLYLNAESRMEAMDLIHDYTEAKDEFVDLYLQMARVPTELLTTELQKNNSMPNEPNVWFETERLEFDWEDPQG